MTSFFRPLPDLPYGVGVDDGDLLVGHTRRVTAKDIRGLREGVVCALDRFRRNDLLFLNLSYAVCRSTWVVRGDLVVGQAVRVVTKVILDSSGYIVACVRRVCPDRRWRFYRRHLICQRSHRRPSVRVR